MLIAPVRSATLTVRTEWPSFVTVGLPEISQKQQIWIPWHPNVAQFMYDITYNFTTFK